MTVDCGTASAIAYISGYVGLLGRQTVTVILAFHQQCNQRSPHSHRSDSYFHSSASSHGNMATDGSHQYANIWLRKISVHTAQYGLQLFIRLKVLGYTGCTFQAVSSHIRIIHSFIHSF